MVIFLIQNVTRRNYSLSFIGTISLEHTLLHLKYNMVILVTYSIGRSTKLHPQLDSLFIRQS